MKPLHKHITTLILGCITGLTFITAQNSTCSNSLATAADLYNEGIIEEIPNLLTPCLQDGFTKNEKIEAYKLMILAYLFDDNQFEAEKAILSFLKDFPDYELMPNDPIEFVYFFKTFKTVPIFTFGFFIGGNIADPVLLNSYTTGNLNDKNNGDAIGLGYNLGIHMNKLIGEKISINIDAQLSGSSYTFIEKVYNINEIKIKEQIQNFSVPITVSYHFTQQKNKPYILLGGGFTYLASSMVIPSRSNILGESGDVTGADINILEHRNTLNYFVTAGIGYKIKLGKGQMVIDARYKMGLLNMVVPEKRYENQTLWNRYYYVQDDYLLSKYSFTIGYNYSIFKPVKR